MRWKVLGGVGAAALAAGCFGVSAASAQSPVFNCTGSDPVVCMLDSGQIPLGSINAEVAGLVQNGSAGVLGAAGAFVTNGPDTLLTGVARAGEGTSGVLASLATAAQNGTLATVLIGGTGAAGGCESSQAACLVAAEVDRVNGGLAVISGTASEDAANSREAAAAQAALENLFGPGTVGAGAIVNDTSRGASAQVLGLLQAEGNNGGSNIQVQTGCQGSTTVCLTGTALPLLLGGNEAGAGVASVLDTASGLSHTEPAVVVILGTLEVSSNGFANISPSGAEGLNSIAVIEGSLPAGLLAQYHADPNCVQVSAKLVDEITGLLNHAVGAQGGTGCPVALVGPT
jgi:hypothetical protein